MKIFSLNIQKLKSSKSFEDYHILYYESQDKKSFLTLPNIYINLTSYNNSTLKLIFFKLSK